MLKENKKIIAVEKPEGDGAIVKRLFPNVYHNHFDPFVLIDEFFVEAPNEFAPHEHSGFEAISYMLGGAFRHEDNQGGCKLLMLAKVLFILRLQEQLVTLMACRSG